jgi:hypothetical protein
MLLVMVALGVLAVMLAGCSNKRVVAPETPVMDKSGRMQRAGEVKEPVKPKNVLVSGRIPERGWCDLASEAIFKSFREPIAGSEGGVWTYEHESEGRLEKLQFMMTPGPYGQGLEVSRVYWWPANQGLASQLLPQDMLAQTPSIVMFDKEGCTYWVECVLPWPGRKTFMPVSLHRTAVLMLTEGTGWHQKPFDAKTGRRDWVVDDWQDLQKRSNVLYYYEGSGHENMPELLESVEGRRFFGDNNITNHLQ